LQQAAFLDQIKTARLAWDTQLARLRPDQTSIPGVVGNWSVKDLVAHITWSEREMVGVLRSRALVGSDLWNLTNDERNEIVYQQNRGRPLEEVLAEAGQVYRQLLELVSAMSEAELNDPLYITEMPPGLPPWRLLAGNTYIHYQEHAGQLKDWIDGVVNSIK
jgi:hypothetical protein